MHSILDYLNGECLKDSIGFNRVLPYLVKKSDSMTVKMCKELCFDGNRDDEAGGYAYAGVQNRDECWCGNNKPDQPKKHRIKQSECNMPCPGDNSQKCGGPNGPALAKMNVYRNKGMVCCRDK